MGANEVEIETLFRKAGAVVSNGHFIYKSGLHGDTYVNKDRLYLHTGILRTLCFQLAVPFKHKSVQAVVGPALGGIALSQWVTAHLEKLTGNDDIISVFAEKAEDGTFVFRRGYGELLKGRNVLIVEDVLTTGATAAAVVGLVQRAGGDVLGVTALCNRGGVRCGDLAGAPRLHALYRVQLETWSATRCPLCKRNVPINTDLGHGAQFLAGKKTAN